MSPLSPWAQNVMFFPFRAFSVASVTPIAGGGRGNLRVAGRIGWLFHQRKARSKILSAPPRISGFTITFKSDGNVRLGVSSCPGSRLICLDRSVIGDRRAMVAWRRSYDSLKFLQPSPFFEGKRITVSRLVGLVTMIPDLTLKIEYERESKCCMPDLPVRAMPTFKSRGTWSLLLSPRDLVIGPFWTLHECPRMRDLLVQSAFLTSTAGRLHF